jgi:hypothetical protein
LLPGLIERKGKFAVAALCQVSDDPQVAILLVETGEDDATRAGDPPSRECYATCKREGRNRRHSCNGDLRARQMVRFCAEQADQVG